MDLVDINKSFGRKLAAVGTMLATTRASAAAGNAAVKQPRRVAEAVATRSFAREQGISYKDAVERLKTATANNDSAALQAQAKINRAGSLAARDYSLPARYMAQGAVLTGGGKVASRLWNGKPLLPRKKVSETVLQPADKRSWKALASQMADKKTALQVGAGTGAAGLGTGIIVGRTTKRREKGDR